MWIKRDGTGTHLGHHMEETAVFAVLAHSTREEAAYGTFGFGFGAVSWTELGPLGHADAHDAATGRKTGPGAALLKRVDPGVYVRIRVDGTIVGMWSTAGRQHESIRRV